MLSMFKHLKLGLKLGLGFGLVLVLTAIIAVIGYSGIEKLLYRAQTEDRIAQLGFLTLEARQHEKNFIIRGEARYIDEVKQRADGVIATATEARERFYDPADQAAMDQVVRYAQSYFTAFQSYVNAVERQNAAGTEMQDQSRAMEAMVESLLQIERQRFSAWEQSRNTQRSEADVFASAHAEPLDFEQINANRTETNRLMRLLLSAQVDEKNYALRPSASAIQDFRMELAEMRNTLDALKSRQRDASYIATLNEVHAMLGRYEESFIRFTRLEDEKAAAEQQMIEIARDLLVEANRVAALQQERMHSEGIRAEVIMAISALVAILLGILAAFFITRLITVPVSHAVTGLKQIAEGDLNMQISADSRDEIGQLMQALVLMQDNLRRIVSEVRSASEMVYSAAGEISAGNADLSQRTEEQASSLEETASSMEQMTATVKQNADNAQQANQLALRARDTAEQGGQVVANTVAAMTEINHSSSKIADIISVIDEIAFQTNLLALNAAVEAARAGEQGRGFAVVAGEVRNLAQRSAEAAKEIKKLIQDSVAKVEQGSDLVNESGTRLEEIVQAVKKVTDIVSEIAAASQEQATGVEQVNKAVMQMDTVTQQNAALVEEAASASRSLADQSAKLRETMEFFKLETGQHTPTAAPSLTQAKATSGSGASAHSKAPMVSRPGAAKPAAKAPVPAVKAKAPAVVAKPPAPKAAPTPKPVAKAAPAKHTLEDDDEWTEF